MSDDTLLPHDTLIDLSNCDREPIHIPSAVQPHGVLLVLSMPELIVVQASANSALLLGQTPAQLHGHTLAAFIEPDELLNLRNALRTEQLERNPLYLSTIRLMHSGVNCDIIAHVSEGVLVLELEPVQASHSRGAPYRAVKMALSDLQNVSDLTAFFDQVSEQVRSLTGFDRVMIYRFLPDESGEVIAESRNEQVATFKGLHYPASDIPHQARLLYLRNWLRLIPDTRYQPVPLVPMLNPLSGRLLDMSHAVLRSVSPIHLEYLANMGVHASMSISLVQDNTLWGLIACHHEHGPHYLSYDVRTACEFLGQVISMQIATRQSEQSYKYRTRLQQVSAQMIEMLADTSDVLRAVKAIIPHLSAFVHAEGVAIMYGGTYTKMGITPTDDELHELVAWVAREKPYTIYATDSISRVLPAAASYATIASGVLAVPISRHPQDMICWFRPEQAHMVTWAGEPHKAVQIDESGIRLSPRKSFAAWQELVRATSEPWLPAEIEAARDLRSAVLTMGRNELLQLNRDLERSNSELDAFAYIASHDLKEPLRGIHNYANFLIEDYQDKLDPSGVEKLQTLARLSQRMESLIESLLYYSRVGRMNLALQETDLNLVVAQACDLLQQRINELGAQIRIPQPLPSLRCDSERIGEVFYNLITNALKYNKSTQPWVEIGALLAFELPALPSKLATIDPLTQVIFVRDNGIGIREKHYETIFRIFRRLHGRDDFGGGTGAGLTIARKFIERHGGRIWLDSTLGVGTTFYFTLDPSEHSYEINDHE